MKTVVLYRSKSGYVKEYAEIISNTLDCEMFVLDEFDFETLHEYDSVIYGGGLYAVGMNGLKKFKKQIQGFTGKVFIYASGATPPRESDINEVKRMNFTTEELSKYSFFYMRGGFDFSKLTRFDTVLMKLLKWKLKHKKNKSNDEVGMLHAYDQPLSFVSEKNTRDLIHAVMGVTYE